MRGEERIAPALHARRDPAAERVLVRDGAQRARGDRGERDVEAELRRDARAERGEPDVRGHAQLPDVVRRRHPDLDHDLPVARRPWRGAGARRLREERREPRERRRVRGMSVPGNGPGPGRGADGRAAEEGDVGGRAREERGRAQARRACGWRDLLRLSGRRVFLARHAGLGAEGPTANTARDVMDRREDLLGRRWYAGRSSSGRHGWICAVKARMKSFGRGLATRDRCRTGNVETRLPCASRIE